MMIAPATASAKVTEASTLQISLARGHRRSMRPPAVVAFLLAAVALGACENPQAPVSCGPIPQQTVNVGESTSVSVCFNDANGDMLAYTATSSNPSVATAVAAGSSVTVTAVSPGSAGITITARDPGGLQATAVVNVTVPNRAPRAVGTIAPLTVVGGETARVDVSGNFMEPDGQSLSYSASSSNPSVATAAVSGSTVTVTAVGRGMATVTVTATDPGGESATQSFQVTVPNRAPEPRGTIPAATVEAGKTSTVDLSSYFTDADGDALRYSASSSATAVATVAVSGAILTITAVAPGTATVTVTAADPDGETATQSFQVTVPNRTPTPVGTIPAQSLTEGGTKSLVLAAYFTDPDGDALTYTAANANPAVALGTVSGSVLTIRAVSVGFSAITITARDPGGLTATQIVTVEVTTRNSAPQPQGTIPAQSITVGRSATVNLTSYFADPDGDALSYTASAANPGVATATAAGATLTITGQSPGSTTVTITARDPGGLTATQVVSVSVGTAAKPDLLFSSVTPTSVTIAPGSSKAAVFTIRNAGNANSAPTRARGHQSPNANITTSDRVVSSPIAVGALQPNGTHRIELTLNIPSNFQPGSFYVGMCVDAVTGESNTANNCSSAVRVTVAVSNRAPEPRGTIPAQSVTTGQTATLDVSAYFTDPDGDPLSYTASSSNPSVATFALTGSTLTLRGVAQGTTTITVVASDPGGLTAAQVVSVTVGTANAPDLLFSKVAPTALTIASGGKGIVKFTIRNAGSVNAVKTSAHGYRSADATITTSDVDLGRQSVNPLAANAETTIGLSATVPANTQPGSVLYVGMCVDQVTGETNTANNCSSAVKVSVVAGATRLTTPSAANMSAAWSPDGSKIAFTSWRDGYPEIYVVNANGTGLMRLTNHATGSGNAAWSPDGRKIAFDSGRDDNQADIYVMNTDGSGVTRLTSNSTYDLSPAWSPDGRKIAFETDRDGNREIYVMNADGTGVTRLTSHSADDGAPAWSPDGRKIAFHTARDGNFEIYAMDSDGSNVSNLTNNSTFDGQSAWSPDGTKIAFTSNRDGPPEDIYVMNFPASDGIGAGQAEPARLLWRTQGRPLVPHRPASGQTHAFTDQIRVILRELPQPIRRPGS